MSEDDRPKRSWSEIDKLRDGTARREERRPRGKAAEARAQNATEQYLKQAGSALFSEGKRGGAEGDALAKAVLEAHGSPDFDAACAAYLEDQGPPEDERLIGALLDARDPEIRTAALRGLEAALDGGRFEPERALRNRVRGLAEELDDRIAEAAEDVLAKLSS